MVWSVRRVDSVVLSPYRGAYVMEYSLAGLCLPWRSRPQPPSSLTRMYNLGDLLFISLCAHAYTAARIDRTWPEALSTL